MRFTQTGLPGVYLIELEPVVDERGFFARTWCRREAAEHRLDPRIAQCNVSFNRQRGTLRGMHYQAAPHQEVKVVHCSRGAIHDVIVDIREGSATHLQWLGIDLSAANRLHLYIPDGFAHGFQSLEDESEVVYQMSEFHHPESARGLRWDDPALGLRWPLPDPIVSDRDRSYPLLDRGRADGG